MAYDRALPNKLGRLVWMLARLVHQWLVPGAMAHAVGSGLAADEQGRPSVRRSAMMGVMTDFNEFNRGVIAEFRANGGNVSGTFDKMPMILVTHIGAKSGTAYTSPLVYTTSGTSFVIIASKGGAPDDPQWFRNLVANPEVTIEVGTETIPVRARVAADDERERLYRAQADVMPNFDEYAKNTTRQIPVVVLDRR